MTSIDTPLTRQQRKYEALLADKEQEIADLKVKIATVRGINDLLKFELVALEKTIASMQKSLDEVKDHVRTLKLNLPDIDR